MLLLVENLNLFVVISPLSLTGTCLVLLGLSSGESRQRRMGVSRDLGREKMGFWWWLHGVSSGDLREMKEKRQAMRDNAGGSCLGLFPAREMAGFTEKKGK